MAKEGKRRAQKSFQEREKYLSVWTALRLLESDKKGI